MLGFLRKNVDIFPIHCSIDVSGDARCKAYFTICWFITACLANNWHKHKCVAHTSVTFDSVPLHSFFFIYSITSRSFEGIKHHILTSTFFHCKLYA